MRIIVNDANEFPATSAGRVVVSPAQPQIRPVFCGLALPSRISAAESQPDIRQPLHASLPAIAPCIALPPAYPTRLYLHL